jgi:amino acid adenylation domain-containing protein
MLISEQLQDALAGEFWQAETSAAVNTGLFTEMMGNDTAGNPDRRRMAVPLSREYAGRVKDLCDHSPELVFNFYATAFSILLHKYFSAETVSFISPRGQFVADDTRFFLFRTEITEEKSFRELFTDSKAYLAKSLNNCCTLQQVKKYTSTANMAALTEFGFITGNHFSAFDDYPPAFIFSIEEGKEDYFFVSSFTAAPFREELLQLLGLNFNRLLGDILLKMYEPIPHLSWQSETEQQLLNDFNSVEPYFSLQENVVELIAKQAALHPGKTAVQYKEKTISYGELELLSDRLAGYLQAVYPSEPDKLFGVMMDRSATMAVCILAVWKAGAAYVPIDKNYPDERIRQIVQLSAMNALLTDNTVEQLQLDRLSLAVPVFNTDRLSEELPAEYKKIKITPAQQAYVIYTSGSTGQPKGVMIEHLGMTNHIGAKVTEMGITPQSKVAQNAVHTFDISVWQFFSALVTGGTTVVYDNDTVMDPSLFTRQIAADEIDVLELVPSYLVEMLSFLEQEYLPLPFLRILILNAETLMPAMVKRWLALYPSIPIVNTYGATEAADDISHYIMYECPVTNTVPVLKRPIQYVEVHIVNDRLQHVPVGTKGEILLAGPGIGRGYLNDEEKTKRSFLKGPINGITARERVYRTGDTGRYLPDGTMEFSGRKDTQVKIRGHRVELGEIEHTLMDISGIGHAAVLINAAHDQLIAYYQSPEQLAKEYLQQAVSEKLPDYMVPHHFIWMEKFPVTANGKIDRKNLPLPESGESAHTYIAPRNETETQLALIWQHILGKEKIGVNDDFFELGGHSLKLTRLAGQLHKAFHTIIAVKDLFTVTKLGEQAALIERSARNEFVSIPVAPLADDYPVTPAQQRMWVLSQLDEGNSAYNMPGVFVLEGELDRDALAFAYRSLIERHESLRTVFIENEQGELRQSVHAVEKSNVVFAYNDLCGTPDPANKVREILQKEFTNVFDLAAGPLLRACLYRLEGNKYVFGYVLHHIISDGWSTDILKKELAAFYNLYTGNRTGGLTPLRIQYRDYAVWLQQELEKPGSQQHRDYWLQQFAGELPVLELPGDHSRPAVKTYNGRQLTWQINAGLTSKLKYTGQQQGATLFMGLLGVITCVLHRYTAQEDIIIGSPVAGREHADLEDQIGLYVNTLALRNRFSGEDSFSQLLSGIRQTTLDAYAHQSYPFDQLVNELHLKRDTSRNPLFDVMLVLQNTGDDPATADNKLGKATISGLPGEADLISKFDLLFDFTESGDTLLATIQYNADIFDHNTIERLSAHVEAMLLAVVSSPGKAISELHYLPSWEENLLLHEFNATAAAFPAHKTLLSLFEEQVRERGHETALVFRNNSFTYKELSDRADRLASYIHHRYKIAKGSQAGIKLERSEWLIISILAVLKTGAAYVPIDPEYPEDRVKYMVENSNCGVLIDEQELDSFRQSLLQEELPLPVSTAGPRDLAYIIYTSGSTGRPKGCMLEHRGIVNRLEWMWQQYRFSQKDIILQKTTFTFDVSVWELFLPLCWGAKMVLCEKADIASPERIAGLIEEQKVSCLHFVPGMLNAFMGNLFEETGIAARLQSLRMVVTSGEALSLASVKKWYEKLAVPLHNLYGPTEASVDVTHYTTSATDTRIPIGKPVWNTEMYILGKGDQLQPVGIAGEICIGGVCLSRGYINNEELTKEKFIVHPFKTGEKLYRTGDTGRWLRDGNIEYLGRRDNQVKIRGYRIETGEIEEVLQSYPAINTCAVLAPVMENGERELVAYIAGNHGLTTGELREWLSAKLPAYMIPGKFVELEKMPQTSSGKTDRRALAASGGKVVSSGVEYAAPRNETERKLAAIWEEVLGRERVGINENFFDAGGNSLRLIRMVRRINNQQGVKMELVTAFRHPTIAALAACISESKPARETEQADELAESLKIMETTFDSLNYAGDEK